MSCWKSRFVFIQQSLLVMDANWLCQMLMHLLGSKHIQMKSYYSTANGIIEQFYQQLKASLETYPKPDRWVNALPMVHPGMCNALK